MSLLTVLLVLILIRAGYAKEEIIVELPGGEKMEFVWIEPGTFIMGSPKTFDRPTNEAPQHEVTITRGFYLGKYEITQGQWDSVMGSHPRPTKEFVRNNPSHPQVCISWNDVQSFIQRLNVTAGDETYRLPTEAEWEYAAKAGTTSRWSFGNDESLLGEYAWYKASSRLEGVNWAQPVGTKRPNPWGLYDMHGNVFEWTQNWFAKYNSHAVIDPQGPQSGSSRAFRGGYFDGVPLTLGSAFRRFAEPSFNAYWTGARLLRTGVSATSNTLESWGQIKDDVYYKRIDPSSARE